MATNRRHIDLLDIIDEPRMHIGERVLVYGWSASTVYILEQYVNGRSFLRCEKKGRGGRRNTSLPLYKPEG